MQLKNKISKNVNKIKKRKLLQQNKEKRNTFKQNLSFVKIKNFFKSDTSKSLTTEVTKH